MTKSKWTDSSSAKELLNRISKLKLKTGQQCMMILSNKNFKSAFDSSGFDNYAMLLKEQARFNSEVPDSIKQEMVNKSIWESADNNKLEQGYVGNILKRIESEYLAQDSRCYYLVTGVSINGLKSKRTIKTPKANLVISNYFPQKFKSSYDFKQAKALYPRINNKCYSWVTVQVSARCVHSAAEIAFKELDYWRSIFNIYCNFNQNRTSFSKPSPINKICKYPYHSLHLENGDRATQLYWFEPNSSTEISSFNMSEKYDEGKSFYQKLSSDVCNSGNLAFFTKSLNRYCSALDTSNMNSSFLALWSLLESLTFTGHDNYDVTIARTLVLFKDKFKLKLELEILRDKRNMAIHSGSQFEEAEKYAYMLMNIIHQYIFFLVNAITKSKSINQLKSTLDLPLNKSKLEKMRLQYEDEMEKLTLIEKLINIEP
jgi:hypothetical protein